MPPEVNQRTQSVKAKTASTALQSDESRARRRSAVACRNCNLRKVRCNVATSGSPCANCQHDNAVCEIAPRKKHGPKRKHVLQTAQSENSTSFQPGVQQQPLSPLGHQHPVQTVSPVTFPSPHTAHNSYSALSISNASLPENLHPDIGSSASNSDQDEAVDTATYAAALDADEQRLEDDNPGVLYIGDQQGMGTFVFDLCNGPSQQSHFLVPRVTRRTQRPEDLAYLRLKGCFSLPSPEACDDLIKCYFQHVHLFLPIIEAKRFLEEYVQHGYQNINLLLLWSMFFASSNFVEPDILSKAGYKSRRAMKRSMYQCAKSLYDSDCEEDKVSLIQSTILLAFWYSDVEDRTGAWHWMGIAISLCQTMGMHRIPSQDNIKHHLLQDRFGLFRRIWWSCFVRDRWLSLSMGRPLRINLDDCDTPMPSAEDVTNELKSLSPQIYQQYIPASSSTLAPLWIKLLKISNALGASIRALYGRLGTEPRIADMKRCEQMILECELSNAEKLTEDRTTRLFVDQIQLFYETAIIVLQRPFVLQKADSNDPQESISWQSSALQKAKTAATNINTVLSRLIDLNMVKYLKPMTVTCLIPAMQIHLLESTSPDPLQRQFGTHKFRLCMMVLSELRGTYYGANVMYKLFERAEAKLQENRSSNSNSAPRASVRRQSENSVLLTPEPSTSSGLQSDGIDTYSNLFGPHMDVLNANNFMWNQLDMTWLGMSDLDSFVANNGGLLQDGFWQGDTQRMNQGQLENEIHQNYAINELLSLEEFNNQCLYTAQPRQ